MSQPSQAQPGGNQPKVTFVQPLPKHLRPQERPNLGARVVENGTLYYGAKDRQPVSFPYQYSRSVLSEIQPYSRDTVIATHEWRRLDLGWFADSISDIGEILIVNKEGRFSQTNPYPEEVAKEQLKILQIGFALDPCKDLLDFLPALEIAASFDTYTLKAQVLNPVPEQASRIYIRCKYPHSPTRYSITILPR